jgi:lysozyme
MTTSDKGITILKLFEGFSAHAYKDSAGLDTIGYGTLIDQQSEMWLIDAVINEKTAEVLLKTDIKPTEDTINKLVKKPLNQNQFDALVCFTYNVGRGAFKVSTLLKKINVDPNDETIRNEFMKWSKVGKTTNKGLLNRRTKESELYFEGVE